MDVSTAGFEASIFVIKPPEQFSCALCLNILNDPRQCSNGHCFCFGCISAALFKHNTCPICKEAITLMNLTKNLVVSTVISEMNVFCVSRDNHVAAIGESEPTDICQWIGPLHTRRAHFKTECGYYVTKCEFVGCGKHRQRRLMPEHAQACLFRRIRCDFCNDSRVYLLKNLETHKIQCEFRPVACTNECSVIVPFNQLDSHLQTDCPLQLVECPLKTLLGVCRSDCPGMLTRESVETHVVGPDSLYGSVMRVAHQFASVRLDQSKLMTVQADWVARNVDVSSRLDEVCDRVSCVSDQVDVMEGNAKSVLTACGSVSDRMSALDRQVAELKRTVDSLLANDRRRLEKIGSLDRSLCALSVQHAALQTRMNALEGGLGTLQTEGRRLGGLVVGQDERLDAAGRQWTALHEAVETVRKSHDVLEERHLSGPSVVGGASKIVDAGSEVAASENASFESVSDVKIGSHRLFKIDVETSGVQASTISPSSVSEAVGFEANLKSALRDKGSSKSAAASGSPSAPITIRTTKPDSDPTERVLSAFMQQLQGLHVACLENSWDNPVADKHQKALRQALTAPEHSVRLLHMLFTEPSVGLAGVVFRERFSLVSNRQMLVSTYVLFAQSVVGQTRNALWVVDDMCSSAVKTRAGGEALRYLRGLLRFRLPECALVEADYQRAKKATVKVKSLKGMKSELCGEYTFCEMGLHSASYRREGSWDDDAAARFEICKHQTNSQGTQFCWYMGVMASCFDRQVVVFLAPAAGGKEEMFPPRQGWKCVDPNCTGCPLPVVEIVVESEKK